MKPVRNNSTILVKISSLNAVYATKTGLMYAEMVLNNMAYALNYRSYASRKVSLSYDMQGVTNKNRSAVSSYNNDRSHEKADKEL